MKTTTGKKSALSLGKLFNKKKTDNGLNKHEKINIERQWKTAFIGLALLGLALVVWEVYLFLQIDSNSIFITSSNESVTIDTLDKGELESVLKYYKEKERVFEGLYGPDVLNFNPPVIESGGTPSEANFDTASSSSGVSSDSE